MKTRNWRTARIPVRTHEVTDRMLVHARKDADSSSLAQTVWPARWFGRDFLGIDALLINGAAVMNRRPADAAKDSEPLLTVLPTGYLESMAGHIQDHKDGLADWCGCGYGMS